MRDKRTLTNIPEDAPVFSVYENAAPQTETKAVWTKGIDTDIEAEAFKREFAEHVEPWIKMGDVMMNQINYAMLTMSALNKNKSDKATDMLDRLRPIVALKEVIDVTVTQRATNLLDKLEKGELR